MKKNQSKNQSHTSNGLFLLLFMLVSFGFTANSFSQSIVVTGTITDHTGMPLPGATVIVKSEPTIGVQTDLDGNYSINAPSKEAVLVYSYLGFLNQEIRVENQTTINVSLVESTESLGEVVIVGYGTQKKSDVTGAISSVKAEDLNKVVTTSPVEALQGRVAGVTVTASSGSPGSTADITIRGIGSFGNNQPLYIVDGVQADPYFINSNDIVNVELDNKKRVQNYTI